MRKLLIGLCVLGTTFTYAIEQVSCTLDGSVSLNGNVKRVYDNSIVGKIKDRDVIFDLSNGDYEHVRKIGLGSNDSFTYTVQGVDYTSKQVTIILNTMRKGSAKSETTSIFKIPLSEKRFVGESSLRLDKQKYSYKVKFTCDLK